MEAYAFERLSEAHRVGVVDIFNHYVRTSTAAYRGEAVGYEFFERFTADADAYPAYAILDASGAVVGFCTLEPFMPIPTFFGTAEVMYFIHKDHTGKGIGTLALRRLEDDARLMGITRLVADISSDNVGSVRFHEGRGFKEYGRLDDVGRKLGVSFGVVYMQKML
jgi:phosphinothricin acetyltransferase